VSYNKIDDNFDERPSFSTSTSSEKPGFINSESTNINKKRRVNYDDNNVNNSSDDRSIKRKKKEKKKSMKYRKDARKCDDNKNEYKEQ